MRGRLNLEKLNGIRNTKFEDLHEDEFTFVLELLDETIDDVGDVQYQLDRANDEINDLEEQVRELS